MTPRLRMRLGIAEMFDHQSAKQSAAGGAQRRASRPSRLATGYSVRCRASHPPARSASGPANSPVPKPPNAWTATSQGSAPESKVSTAWNGNRRKSDRHQHAMAQRVATLSHQNGRREHAKLGGHDQCGGGSEARSRFGPCQASAQPASEVVHRAVRRGGCTREYSSGRLRSTLVHDCACWHLFITRLQPARAAKIDLRIRNGHRRNSGEPRSPAPAGTPRQPRTATPPDPTGSQPPCSLPATRGVAPHTRRQHLARAEANRERRHRRLEHPAHNLHRVVGQQHRPEARGDRNDEGADR